MIGPSQLGLDPHSLFRGVLDLNDLWDLVGPQLVRVHVEPTWVRSCVFGLP